MTKTLFLLVSLVVAFARTSYAGLLDDYFRHSNDEGVDCREEDEEPGPTRYHVSSIATGARLAYGQNPEYEYRPVSFEPENLFGNTLLPFYLPLCSDYSLVPASPNGKEQQLYMDKKLQLYLTVKDTHSSDEYQPVLLHYNPNNKSVFVSICNDFKIQSLCLAERNGGAVLSTDCNSEYSLNQVAEVSASLFQIIF